VHLFRSFGKRDQKTSQATSSACPKQRCQKRRMSGCPISTCGPGCAHASAHSASNATSSARSMSALCLPMQQYTTQMCLPMIQ
jgi:hypothetical protein